MFEGCNKSGNNEHRCVICSKAGKKKRKVPNFRYIYQLSKKLEVPVLRLDLPVVTFPCASCDSTLWPSEVPFLLSLVSHEPRQRWYTDWAKG